MAQQYMASTLTGIGQKERTRQLLSEVQPSEKGNLLGRRLWFAADIIHGKRRPDLAQRSIVEHARDVFLELGRIPDADEVTREMALVDSPAWITDAEI